MAESWIKVHLDVLHDPKILRLHPISRYAWIGLLLLARTGNPPGTWKATSAASAAEDLTLALGLDDPMENEQSPLVGGDFQRMVDAGMVTLGHDGLVTVCKWAQRQGRLNPSDSPELTRERKRAQRVRERHELSRPVTTDLERSREKREKDQLQLHAPENGAARSGYFERFWTAYPKKRSKGDALKAWSTLKPTAGMAERILAAIERLKLCRDWLKDGGKWIPYPATWLRAMGWEDDPGQPRTGVDELEGL